MVDFVTCVTSRQNCPALPVARDSRLPHFRLCLPRIRKKLRLSCRVPAGTPSSSNVPVPHVAASWSLWYLVYSTWRKVGGAYQPRCTPLFCRGRTSVLSASLFTSAVDRSWVAFLNATLLKFCWLFLQPVRQWKSSMKWIVEFSLQLWETAVVNITNFEGNGGT